MLSSNSTQKITRRRINIRIRRFTLTGYPTGEYYRLRGSYAAVKDGLLEGFGPVTDGILIQ